ncbi:transporter substrate-binding domain-containing protein [Telmatospirillum sp.]|uniref:substrate-binding periplasmic protein n=1 Tax=Telmatospirillum sp. TaxID=2079197 RepID=UPI00284087D8|nr:transporter substrate-binding domain-containing protein [Telmatospirillum sp.]MDR3436223.1 transporter substrate-binding domain-containing protein [Telmatospirillum sp.]
MPSIGRWLILLGVGTLVTAGAAESHSEELSIFTDDNAPMSFDENGKASGLGAEIVDEIQRRLMTNDRIRVVPWARAYRDALTLPNVALFTTMRTSARESSFKWVGPLATVKTSFYAKKGSNINISSLEDAKKVKRIGTPVEYYTEELLVNYGFHNIEPAPSTKTVVKKLLADRNQIIALNNVRIATVLRTENIAPDRITLVYTFLSSDIYIAFSKGTSDELVSRWQNALDEMKRDGAFEKIYEKWLPGETPPGIDHR